MKTRKIENAGDLRAEIRRLKELSVVQENVIREDIAEIRERLKPKNILVEGLASITGINFDTKNIFEGGLSAGLLLILRRYISRMETKAEDTVYSLADRLFERIRHFISKYMHVRRRYPGDGEDA
jgi:hypothetical protein